MTNLISPLLWQTMPFRDADAWLDFLGTHELWHRVIASQLKLSVQTLDDLRQNLEPHQLLHWQIAKSLQLSPVGDLVSYDLNDEDSFVSWMQTHALDTDRLGKAAGL